MGHDRDPDTEKNSYRFCMNSLLRSLPSTSIVAARPYSRRSGRAKTVLLPTAACLPNSSAGRVLDCACGRGFSAHPADEIGLQSGGQRSEPRKCLRRLGRAPFRSGSICRSCNRRGRTCPAISPTNSIACFALRVCPSRPAMTMPSRRVQGMCAVLKQGGLCIVTCPKNWPLPNGHRFFPNPPYAKSQAETETIAFEVWREEPSFVKLELLYLTGREGEWDLRAASTLMRKLSGDVLQDSDVPPGFSQVDVAESRDAHAAGPDPVIGWTATGRK